MPRLNNEAGKVFEQFYSLNLICHMQFKLPAFVVTLIPVIKTVYSWKVLRFAAVTWDMHLLTMVSHVKVSKTVVVYYVCVEFYVKLCM